MPKRTPKMYADAQTTYTPEGGTLLITVEHGGAQSFSRTVTPYANRAATAEAVGYRALTLEEMTGSEWLSDDHTGAGRVATTFRYRLTR
jgi:hypothetical protein